MPSVMRHISIATGAVTHFGVNDIAVCLSSPKACARNSTVKILVNADTTTAAQTSGAFSRASFQNWKSG